jgi:Tfp pilus assembly protein PilN
MIKVNLLPLRKPKRAADPAAKQLAVGLGVIAAAAVLVFVLVDRPRRARLAEIEASNGQIQEQINAKNKQLDGYAALQQAADAADKREKSIDRLLAAKVIPAHVMQELGDLLTPGKLPTMTEEMAKRTSNGPDGDSNKRFAFDWDPTHVWMTSFLDNGGTFVLEGGAQSESDVNQLAKRMAASVYFMDVTPARGEAATDPATGIAYYKFTITGKVAY